jgi:hypothetical protein
LPPDELIKKHICITYFKSLFISVSEISALYNIMGVLAFKKIVLRKIPQSMRVRHKK